MYVQGESLKTYAASPKDRLINSSITRDGRWAMSKKPKSAFNLFLLGFAGRLVQCFGAFLLLSSCVAYVRPHDNPDDYTAVLLFIASFSCFFLGSYCCYRSKQAAIIVDVAHTTAADDK